MSLYETDQEKFWAGEFGDGYIARNESNTLLMSKVALWARMLRSAAGITSVLELGCNIGLNLRALKCLKDGLELSGVEINKKAAEEASLIPNADIVCGSILHDLGPKQHDLTFTCGVLIHINPEHLPRVYESLYNKSKRYVLVAEYYNPSPVSVRYRGSEDKLFKRDFAGDLMDAHQMRLIDYGFVYKRDHWAPQDDITWFLLEK